MGFVAANGVGQNPSLLRPATYLQPTGVREEWCHAFVAGGYRTKTGKAPDQVFGSPCLIYSAPG